MGATSRLASRLAHRNGVAVLDGGMGTGLAGAGLDTRECWTAGWRLDEGLIRGAVLATHLAYLRAGADVLTANTYRTSQTRLWNMGMAATAAEAQRLEAQHIAANVAVARDAIESWQQEAGGPAGAAPAPLLAASIGTYATSMMTRSETANRVGGDLAAERISGFGIGQAALEEHHFSHARNALAAGADLLAFETIVDLVEARAIAAVVAELQAQVPAGRQRVEAWVSFTCREGGSGVVTDHGDELSDCFEALAGIESIVGIGFNCTEPVLAPALLETARNMCGEKVVVCYPNSGEVYDMSAGTASTTGGSKWRRLPDAPEAGPAEFAAMAQSWAAQGAQVLGGCCRIGPEHIRALSDAFPRGDSGR